MKRVLIQVVLVAIAIFLTFKVYDSVRTPIDFKKEMTVRYSDVVQNLKDIRKAELAYKDVHGKFTGSWDTLINFVKNDSLPLVRKIGSLTDSMIDAGWTEEMALKKGKIIRDTIRVLVQDSLFTPTTDVEQLRFIPNSGNQEFNLARNTVVTGSGVKVEVFEARAHNQQILSELYADYEQEIINLNEKRRVNNKYPGLKVGSLEEANNNSGNWE